MPQSCTRALSDYVALFLSHTFLACRLAVDLQLVVALVETGPELNSS